MAFGAVPNEVWQEHLSPHLLCDLQISACSRHLRHAVFPLNVYRIARSKVVLGCTEQSFRIGMMSNWLEKRSCADSGCTGRRQLVIDLRQEGRRGLLVGPYCRACESMWYDDPCPHRPTQAAVGNILC